LSRVTLFPTQGEFVEIRNKEFKIIKPPLENFAFMFYPNGDVELMQLLLDTWFY